MRGVNTATKKSYAPGNGFGDHAGSRDQQWRHVATSDVILTTRIRPAFADEDPASNIIYNSHSSQLTITPSNRRQKEKRYTFDSVFGPNATQAEVYRGVAAIPVQESLRGRNCCVFAYGQTGAGKTYSTFGPDLNSLRVTARDASQLGVIPRAMHELFEAVEDLREAIEFRFHVSYLQIYMETVQDLLAHLPSSQGGHAKQPQDLPVRESLHGPYVEGLTIHRVDNVQEVLVLLEAGAKHKTVSSTKLNRSSSRGHTLFCVTISRRMKPNVATKHSDPPTEPQGVWGSGPNESEEHNEDRVAEDLAHTIHSSTPMKQRVYRYKHGLGRLDEGGAGSTQLDFEESLARGLVLKDLTRSVADVPFSHSGKKIHDGAYDEFSRAASNLGGEWQESRLTFVDLAGSERVHKSGADGITLSEAKSINKSLSALGNVIAALSRGGTDSDSGAVPLPNFVPWRDSKLTRLLQPCLSGKSLISLLLTISPSKTCLGETMNTLLFGCRTKKIGIQNALKEAGDWKALALQLQKDMDALIDKQRQQTGAMMEKYDNMKQEIQELQVRLRDSEDARKTAERFASEAQDLVEAAEKRADQANEESADAFRRMRAAENLVETLSETLAAEVARDSGGERNQPSSNKASPSQAGVSSRENILEDALLEQVAMNQRLARQLETVTATPTGRLAYDLGTRLGKSFNSGPAPSVNQQNDTNEVTSQTAPPGTPSSPPAAFDAEENDKTSATPLALQLSASHARALASVADRARSLEEENSRLEREMSRLKAAVRALQDKQSGNTGVPSIAPAEASSPKRHGFDFARAPVEGSVSPASSRGSYSTAVEVDFTKDSFTRSATPRPPSASHPVDALVEVLESWNATHTRDSLVQQQLSQLLSSFRTTLIQPELGAPTSGSRHSEARVAPSPLQSFTKRQGDVKSTDNGGQHRQNAAPDKTVQQHSSHTTLDSYAATSGRVSPSQKHNSTPGRDSYMDRDGHISQRVQPIEDLAQPQWQHSATMLQPDQAPAVPVQRRPLLKPRSSISSLPKVHSAPTHDTSSLSVDTPNPHNKSTDDIRGGASKGTDLGKKQWGTPGGPPLDPEPKHSHPGSRPLGTPVKGGLHPKAPVSPLPPRKGAHESLSVTPKLRFDTNLPGSPERGGQKTSVPVTNQQATVRNSKPAPAVSIEGRSNAPPLVSKAPSPTSRRASTPPPQLEHESSGKHFQVMPPPRDDSMDGALARVRAMAKRPKRSKNSPNFSRDSTQMSVPSGSTAAPSWALRPIPPPLSTPKKSPAETPAAMGRTLSESDGKSPAPGRRALDLTLQEVVALEGRLAERLACSSSSSPSAFQDEPLEQEKLPHFRTPPPKQYTQEPGSAISTSSVGLTSALKHTRTALSRALDVISDNWNSSAEDVGSLLDRE